jgi:hypothetical protein
MEKTVIDEKNVSTFIEDIAPIYLLPPNIFIITSELKKMNDEIIAVNE